MKTAPGLVGASLVFWGWQTGLLPLAVVAALVLEGSRFVSWRWELAASDQNRIADLSTVAFVALAVYVAVTLGVTRAAILTLEWLPLSLLPAMMVQAYGREGKISATALFWSLRKMPAASSGAGLIDLTFVYVVVCVLSASAANVRTPWFYVCVVGLAAWALWPARSRTFSPFVWAGSLLVAGIAGYGGHVGLQSLQKIVESLTSDLFANIPADTDPYRTHTAIGQIGSLKLSDRIVLRVDAGPGVVPPFLLLEASYNLYTGTTWLAVATDFTALPPPTEAGTWTLVPARAGERSLTVAQSLRRGKGVLVLPAGSITIDGLPGASLKRNRLGAVRVEEGPAFVTYRVTFDPSISVDGPPTDADLRLPRGETPLLVKLAADLDLRSRPPGDAVRAVDAFLRSRFRYSMYLGSNGSGVTIADFLQRSRSGHCEYFATATVLLLRAAGIPARYTIGYSVREWSGLERRYIVRARHGHAWARAWVNEAWRDVDTTPPVWAVAEQAQAPIWEPVSDVWAWATFNLSWWWASDAPSALARRFWWLILLPAAWIVWRLLPRERARRVRADAQKVAAATRRPGDDSEFYAIEKRLGDQGLGRRADEPVSYWLRRIESSYPPATRLHPLAALHARYRFDPVGISRLEREALRSGVEEWVRDERVSSSADASSDRSDAG